MKKINKLFKISAIIIISAIIFVAGNYDSKKTHILHHTKKLLTGIIDKNIDLPSDYLNGVFSKPEKINIEIEKEDYNKLMNDREIAINRGILLDDHNSEIPIKISYNNKTYEAKAKLKGDFPDHFGDKKYSLRINIKGDEKLKELDEFSLQQPRTRSFLTEWVGHMMMENENLIKLKTDYVDVIINGKKMGIYQLEEFFDNSIIKNNDLPDGIVFRQVGPGTDLNIYSSKKINSSKELSKHLATLYEKYDAFVEDKLSVENIFDVEKMAKYYAITDLICGHHALFYNNLHFYYNSETQLIEPIGREWNGDGFKDLKQISIDMLNFPDVIEDNPLDYWLHKKLFQNELFIAEYYKALNRISDHKYLDDFFEEISDAMNSNLNILYKDYPFYNYDRFYLYWNQKTIQEKLDPERPINAYYISNNPKQSVYIKNLTYFPIALKSMYYKNDTISINDTISAFNDLILPVEIQHTEENYDVIFNYLGANKLFKSKALPQYDSETLLN